MSHQECLVGVIQEAFENGKLVESCIYFGNEAMGHIADDGIYYTSIAVFQNPPQIRRKLKRKT